MTARDKGMPVTLKRLDPGAVSLRLASKVAGFSTECQICQGLQIQIGQLDESLTGYLDVMKDIVLHLKCSHGLVEKGHYAKRCLLIGFSAGISLVLLGLVLVSFGITLLAWNITLVALVFRVILGYTVGYFLDKRSEKKGRVL